MIESTPTTQPSPPLVPPPPTAPPAPPVTPDPPSNGRMSTAERIDPLLNVVALARLAARRG